MGFIPRNVGWKMKPPSTGLRIQVFKQLPIMTHQLMALMCHTMTKLGMTTDIFSPGGVCRWNEVVVVGYHPLDAWSNELMFAGHTAAASSLLINANQRQLISEELSAVCVMEGFLAWKMLRQCLQTLKSSFGNRLLLVRALVLNSMDRPTKKDHTLALKPMRWHEKCEDSDRETCECNRTLAR